MSINTVLPSAYGPIFTITAQKSNVVLDAAAKAGHEVTRVFGYNSALTSDHRYRQCIDFMHYGNTAMRLWLENYLIRNAGALGIMGIISNRRCMGFPANEVRAVDCEVTWRGPAGVWRPYSGGDPHTDHLHVQFNTTAIQGRVKSSSVKAGPWKGTLYLIRDTYWFDGNGNKRKLVKAGTKIKGTVDTTKFPKDGRYFRNGGVPHRRWFPLDNKNFSHTKNGKAIR